MKILFLSAWFPFPPRNGSELRIYNLLRGLGQKHEVTLLSFADDLAAAAAAEPLWAGICAQVTAVPRPAFNPHSWPARMGFFSPKPRSIIDTYSPAMADQIRQAVDNDSLPNNRYDLVIASQTMMAAYAHLFNGIPALFEEVEIALLHEQYTQANSWRDRLRRGLTWHKHRRYLAHLLDHFRAATVVSEQERTLLRQAVSDQGVVKVVPNCVDVSSYREVTAVPQPATLIYTGSFGYHVNHDAMCWYLSKVHPLVETAVPEVEVIITGDHKGLPLPPARNVQLTGFVADVRPYLASATISLAPILSGGGTRLKILEAMALRTPVVSTSKGAEGLDVEPEHHLLVADTPAEFATAIISLLRDPARAHYLAANAYQLVATRYDWKTVLPSFLSLVEQTGANSQR
jgi:polysaccharide biosynthesis protein PslH